MNERLPALLLLTLRQVSGSSRVATPVGLARRLRAEPAAVDSALEAMAGLGWIWLRGGEVRLTLSGLAVEVASRVPGRRPPAALALPERRHRPLSLVA